MIPDFYRGLKLSDKTTVVDVKSKCADFAILNAIQAIPHFKRDER